MLEIDKLVDETVFLVLGECYGSLTLTCQTRSFELWQTASLKWLRKCWCSYGCRSTRICRDKVGAAWKLMPTSPRVWIKKSKKNRNPPPQLIIVVSHVSPCVLPDPALVKQASGPHPQQGKEALSISVKSTQYLFGFFCFLCCFFFILEMKSKSVVRKVRIIIFIFWRKTFLSPDPVKLITLQVSVP